MDHTERAGMKQAQTYPLETLKQVPISEPYIALMTRVLTEHRAILTETRAYPDAERPYKEYTLTFPPGTVISFGLRMMRSRHFSILFPDGFRLHGGELWPLWQAEGDTATTILYLPK